MQLSNNKTQRAKRRVKSSRREAQQISQTPDQTQVLTVFGGATIYSSRRNSSTRQQAGNARNPIFFYNQLKFNKKKLLRSGEAHRPPPAPATVC
jgi:hypothetical protein